MNQPTEQLLDIAVTNITPNPRQPRQEFEPGALQELADSIKEHGIIQPLVVEPNTDEGTAHYPYVLVAGERRLRAAKLAGLIEVPCIVRCNDSDAQDMLELALIENVQREDLSVADEARAYQQLHDVFNLTDEQIGQRVGKARPTITATRNLAKLPEAVITKIGDGEGQLPKRVVRQLLPLAEAVAARQLIAIADEIAALEIDDEKTPDDVIYSALEDNAWRLPRKGDGWDLAWPGKPIEYTPPASAGGDAAGADAVTAVGGPIIIPACKGCPSCVAVKSGYRGGEYCTNGACFDAKTAAYTAKELDRVSKKLKIPVAGADEQIYTVDLNWRTSAKVNAWKTEPPVHLRLTTKAAAEDDGKLDGYYHKEFLGSPVLALASILKNPFQGKSAEAIAINNSDQPETDAQRQKRIAAEEHTAKAKRAERGALRRARADVAWLGLHAVEVAAPQIPISGNALEFVAWFVDDRARTGGQWPAISKAIDENWEALELVKGKEREALLRQRIVLKMLRENVPSYTNDWELDFEKVATAIEEVITTRADGAGLEYCLGLKLPAGWDKPPIHHTPSNCWHCGKFAPNNRDELTQVDRANGWGVVKVDDDLKDVYCPECGKEIQAKVQADVLHRKVIKSPSGPKQSIGKSKPAPKPSVKKPATKKSVKK